MLSLGLIALSFSFGMLWRGLYATTALQRLTLGLSPQTTPEALRAALADALEDPSLQIAYRLPDALDGWVSETATRVEPPREQPSVVLGDGPQLSLKGELPVLGGPLPHVLEL